MKSKKLHLLLLLSLFKITIIHGALHNNNQQDLKNVDQKSLNKAFDAIRSNNTDEALALIQTLDTKIINTMITENNKKRRSKKTSLLHAAARSWNIPVINVLITKGADQSLLDSAANEPVDVRPDNRSREDWRELIAKIKSKQ